MILSASRRTDLPAFYADWFYHRISDGYFYKYNKKTNSYEKILLTPENIDCIVFWTKNPRPIMKYLDIMNSMGFVYYFQFSITPYSADIEINLQDKRGIVETFKELSKKIGKERVVWRYDPILINNKYDVAFHKKSFAQLCRALSGYTDECVISFVDNFTKGTQKIYYDAPDDKQIEELATYFAAVAKKYHFKLYTCAEKVDLQQFGIQHGACISKEKIESLISYKLNVRKDHSQREACNCVSSIDIGEYYSCLHNCAYCYAGGTDTVRCAYNHQQNDNASPLFIGTVNPKIKVTNKKLPSLASNEQVSLFQT